MIESLTNLALKKLIDLAHGAVQERLGSVPPGVSDLRSGNTREALSKHLALFRRWNSEISFCDLKRPRLLEQAYIELDLLVGIQAGRRRNQEASLQTVSSLLEEQGSIAILGDPGAGKTTSLKHLTAQLLAAPRNDVAALPLWLRLRDTAPDSSVADMLLDSLSVFIKYDEHLSEARKRAVRCRVLSDVLNRLRPVVFLALLDFV